MMTMVHPLDLPPTDLPQRFARLELDSQHGVASEQTEADPQNSSPRMIDTDVRQQVGFLTLPREIRDQIHLNLIVVEDPIQYDTQFESLSRSDTFTDRAIMWMFEVASNTQIAREARETSTNTTPSSSTPMTSRPSSVQRSILCHLELRMVSSQQLIAHPSRLARG